MHPKEGTTDGVKAPAKAMACNLLSTNAEAVAFIGAM